MVSETLSLFLRASAYLIWLKLFKCGLSGPGNGSDPFFMCLIISFQTDGDSQPRRNNTLLLNTSHIHEAAVSHN